MVLLDPDEYRSGLESSGTITFSCVWWLMLERLLNNWEQEYLGLLGHLYLYVVFQHGSFQWTFFACQTRIPKAHVPRDRAPSRSDIAFYDLTSEITLHHFCCILLVEAVTKVHLSSRRGYTDPTSQERNVNIPF